VLGLADRLAAGPAPADVLAEQTGTHAPSLHRLLRTLASVGVFTEAEPGVFALTPLGQTLTSSQPGSMRDVAIMFMETHYAPFGDLLHTIRTGQPAAEHSSASRSSAGCRSTPSRPAGTPPRWPT
jgi:hypothetical protein